MALTSASINVDGTVATTGGTVTALTKLGGSLDTHDAILADGAAFAARTQIGFTAKPPKVSSTAPAGYTQARTSAKVMKPKILANAARTINSLKIELSVDPETTAAEVQTLLVLGAQLLADSDFADFWKQQACT